MRFELRPLRRSLLLTLVFCAPLAITTRPTSGQHTVARQWNDMLLEAIRRDFARPTVHARNLFHSAVAMYDLWAVFDDKAEPWLLGKTVGQFSCDFNGFPAPADTRRVVDEAISYASYRLLLHRFEKSPRVNETYPRLDSLMTALGYPTAATSTDYSSGSGAALGNYMAQCLIDFGMQDGANERFTYNNRYYQPVNPPLLPEYPGNPDIEDLNRWQPLTLETFIDQGDNTIEGSTPNFLSAEWGSVIPFALKDDDLAIHSRGGSYWVYHDPGSPPKLTMDGDGLSSEYQWGFALVSVWSAHLDPADGVMWDISPGSIGNIESLPTTIAELRDFYDLLDGGDTSNGWSTNPVTGQPYEPQLVPRADYARVLAEFWADGPDSETPPGHWFTILNYVNDHPMASRRFKGEGEELDQLEWDVKAYFVLAGAVHDAAVAAWGVKGWYDYIRPVSAIRAMAAFGQSTDPNLDSYAAAGLPLVDGYIELVEPGDSLAGEAGEHVGKIKVKAWRGPDYIEDPDSDIAGVGWILAENWWPYQRPTFVTPPFAGYVSGHSTFSRAAAEVMTRLTGNAFFPGGMGEFEAPANEFLVFEDGPSVDLTLQWATYRDAADQCSLSRIWGGIHPPADDLPGRLIGIEVGVDAFRHAELYFNGQASTVDVETIPVAHRTSRLTVYPNPVSSGQRIQLSVSDGFVGGTAAIFNAIGQRVRNVKLGSATSHAIDVERLPPGVYVARVSGDGESASAPFVVAP